MKDFLEMFREKYYFEIFYLGDKDVLIPMKQIYIIVWKKRFHKKRREGKDVKIMQA